MKSIASERRCEHHSVRQSEFAGFIPMQSDDTRAAILWSYAIALGASREDAADAVQEAFARLLKEARAGTEIRNSDAWLYTTLHHLVVDQARQRGRVQRAISRLSAMRDGRVADDPPEVADDRVWRAVDALPPRQRAAIHLRYRADLDFRTIADIMGISEGAARSYVTKALDRLEERLAQWRVER